MGMFSGIGSGVRPAWPRVRHRPREQSGRLRVLLSTGASCRNYWISCVAIFSAFRASAVACRARTASAATIPV